MLNQEAQKNERSLNGKVIIVTGGTQGLGEGIARHLVKLGIDGLVICGRNEDGGNRVAAALNRSGCRCIYIRADLSRETDCRMVPQACEEEFGRVSGLVNAAGVTTRGTLRDTTVDFWDYMFAVNARAPFILMQEAVKIMKREEIHGSIVNIITENSHCGLPQLMAYSASKGAMVTLTKNIAYALRYDKIRVNGINMGWADTVGEHAMQRSDGQPENWLKLAEARQPFGRLLRPGDVAGLTAYLLGDDAIMMTGSVIDFNQNVVGAPG